MIYQFSGFLLLSDWTRFAAGWTNHFIDPTKEESTSKSITRIRYSVLRSFWAF